MRVLHLGKFYPPVPGGIERALANLAQASQAAGVETAVLAHRPPGHWRSRTRNDDGVTVVEAGCLGQWVYAPLSPAFPGQLLHLLRRLRPDVLHLHLPNTSAFLALVLPQARRIPWIVHWHADIPLDSGRRALRWAYPLYRPWEQALLRRAAAIIATSPDYRDASTALAPWRDKVSVIPLSLDAPPRSASVPAAAGERGDRAATDVTAADDAARLGAVAPLPAGAPPAPHPAVTDGQGRNAADALWRGTGFRLLAVGRLSHYKGYDVLLRAVAEVPEASLLLIGDGEEAAALRTLVQSLRLDARVRLAGHVDEAALSQAYASADAFCLPSLDRAEAFGMVLLEAMRARLPVIASAIPGSGVGYVARAGDTALPVRPGDVGSLIEAIRALALDADLRTRLGTAGYERWRTQFTPAQTTPALLALYRRVLARART